MAPLMQLTTSTTCTQNYLIDGSFEQTNVPGAWPLMDSPGAVTESYATGSAGHEGAGYLVTTTVASGGSVQQTLTFATNAGDYYQGTVWVRADTQTQSPITGSVKLTANGGSNPVESEVTAFSVGTTWTPVTVPLRLVYSHSQIAMTLVMTSVNVSYDWDSANLYFAGLVNGSFDNGNATGWQGYGTINTATYNDPDLVFDGAWFEEFNTAVAGNAIFQDVSLSPSPAQSYEASVWLRSRDGTPVSGSVALWGLGGTQEVGVTSFTVDGNWTLVQAPLDVQNSGHTQLSAAIYLTTTNKNLDVDGATLVNNCLADASMEYTDSTHWAWDFVPTGATVSRAYYTSNDTPQDGAGIQELNTTIAGASLGQDFQGSAPPNSSWQCGMWIRSHDGTQLNGRVDAVGLGGTTEFGSATSFAVGGSWTWVSSPLDVVQANHTAVRCQMYMDTANRNYDIDAASLGPEDIGTFAPPAPTSVSASSAGNTGNASVSWSAPTDDIGWSSSASPLPAPVLDYQVTPYVNGIPQTSGAQTVTGTSASFSGLTGGPYTFAVATGNVYGNGLPAASSTVATIAVPGAPTGVSASPGNGQATVSWTAPSSTNGAPLTGYAITPSLGSTTLQTMVVGTNTAFTVANLANGQSYSFAVAATNNAGTGGAATSNAVIPGLPGAPSGVAAAVGNGQATVSWTAPGASGATAITGYVITPYVAGTAQPATTVWGPGTSGVVTGLSNGTTYTFAVAAMNAFGAGAAATSAGGTPAATVPSAPQSIAATAGNTQASVSWSAPATNGGSAITGYTITPYLNGSPQTPTIATVSPATVSGLTNGSAYTFTVAATNVVGTGAASSASWTAYPASAPVNPSVTMTLDKGANGTYPRGGAATYTATISTNGSTSATVNFSDVLPGGISAQGAAVVVNGQPCAAPVTCSATATTITVNNLTVPSGGHATVAFSVVVTGLERQCATLSDTAEVTIQGGNSAAGSVPLVACDTGLGQTPWWSYVSQALGSQGTAQVNVANGNLVISQVDGIPMPLHGSLTFALRRTYNSQNDGSPLPTGPFGAGWSYSFVDVGSDTGVTSLAPAPFEGINNPAPVVAVDGSGARYVFAASGLSTVIDVDGLSSTSPLATLKPVSLQKGTGTRARAPTTSSRLPPGFTSRCCATWSPPPGRAATSLLRLQRCLAMSSSGPTASGVNSTTGGTC